MSHDDPRKFASKRNASPCIPSRRRRTCFTIYVTERVLNPLCLAIYIIDARPLGKASSFCGASSDRQEKGRECLGSGDDKQPQISTLRHQIPISCADRLSVHFPPQPREIIQLSRSDEFLTELVSFKFIIDSLLSKHGGTGLAMLAHLDNGSCEAQVPGSLSGHSHVAIYWN